MKTLSPFSTPSYSPPTWNATWYYLYFTRYVCACIFGKKSLELFFPWFSFLLLASCFDIALRAVFRVNWQLATRTPANKRKHRHCHRDAHLSSSQLCAVDSRFVIEVPVDRCHVHSTHVCSSQHTSSLKLSLARFLARFVSARSLAAYFSMSAGAAVGAPIRPLIMSISFANGAI